MSVDAFGKLLRNLGTRCAASDDLNEREVVDLFITEGLFAELGYGTVGEDMRLERTNRSGRVDVLLRGVTGRPICVVEFKRPHTDLADHRQQLEAYVRDVLPAYAVLTDGVTLWLFQRDGNQLIEEAPLIRLAEITDDEASLIYGVLHKRTVDWHRMDAVQDALQACRDEAAPITDPQGEGSRIFLDQFALDRQVAFGRLTERLFDALPPLLEQSDFARGAFTFWEKVYARDLAVGDAPKSWTDFLPKSPTKPQLMRFMFVLETAYAILSRLILAKAMHDAEFPLDAPEAFQRGLEDRQRRGQLEMAHFPPAVASIFEEGKRQAFRSLFDNDIFDWWLDLPLLDDAGSDVSEALAEATLAVFQFDFARLSGDLLGHLYQSYFDRETRKALGEFYTPPEVVEFILDQVGYAGASIQTERLLDPACGSGTFLVHALQRYLNTTSDDPKALLKGLTEGFRVVGFDVNPFAVLMAQVNYALHILPTYAEALEHDREFEIATLPVFRTDSLRHEKREGEQEQMEDRGDAGIGMTFEYHGNVARIKTDLPVEVKPGQFLNVEIPVPRFDRALSQGWVANVEEYFRVQETMFSAIREARERGAEAPTVDDLRTRLATGTATGADELARDVHQAVEEILETLEWLKHEYEDGRFLKTLEDLALAMTLKHELRYDHVVGNPPYVRVQDLPELSKRYWQGLYEWASGNFDIYIPFIERALAHWLREGGRIGFICSNRFLLTNYATTLRRRLPEVAEIELITDLRDTRVFKDALNYPAIFVFRHTGHDKADSFVGARVFDDPGQDPEALVREIEGLIEQVADGTAHAQGDHADAFREELAHLRPQGWHLMPPNERHVFRKLDDAASHRLQDLTLTRGGGFQGIATGLDRVFIVRLLEDRGGRCLVQPKGGMKPVEIERDLLRPWLFGHDVERWLIDWDEWYVLFPYVQVNGRYRLMPSKGYREKFDYADKAPLIEDYELAWQYLTANETALRGREGGRFKKGKTEEHLWYGAARPQNLALYQEQKIVVQMSSQDPDMAFDKDWGYVFQAGGRGGGVYGVAIDKARVDPWFVMALLNAGNLDFYLKHISTVYSGHSYSYSDAFIKDLPICLPQTKSEKSIAQSLAQSAQNLSETKADFRTRERDRAAFPEPQLDQLDARPELYPISRLAQGRPQAKQVRADRATIEDREDDWTLVAGRTELAFPSQAHAQAALRWLSVQGKSQVDAGALMAAKLPASELEARKILAILDETEREIERLRRELAEGEANVDAQVAKLYGLTKDDRRVIDDFLGRF